MAHVSYLIPDRPYLSWGFEVKDLQKYVTTLEKICDNPDFAIDHRNDWLDLLSLKWNLQAALGLYEKQQQERSEEPSADDFMAYLTDYSTSIAKGNNDD